MTVFDELSRLIEEAQDPLDQFKEAVSSLEPLFANEEGEASSFEAAVRSIVDDVLAEREATAPDAEDQQGEGAVPGNTRLAKQIPGHTDVVPPKTETDNGFPQEDLLKLSNGFDSLRGQLNTYDGKIATLAGQVGANTLKIGDIGILKAMVANLQAQVAGLSRDKDPLNRPPGWKPGYSED